MLTSKATKPLQEQAQTPAMLSLWHLCMIIDPPLTDKDIIELERSQDFLLKTVCNEKDRYQETDVRL
jgi:hypothetical protein